MGTPAPTSTRVLIRQTHVGAMDCAWIFLPLLRRSIAKPAAVPAAPTLVRKVSICLNQICSLAFLVLHVSFLRSFARWAVYLCEWFLFLVHLPEWLRGGRFQLHRLQCVSCLPSSLLRFCAVHGPRSAFERGTVWGLPSGVFGRWNKCRLR